MKLVFLSFFLLHSLILFVNGATQLTGCNTADFCINVQTRFVCSGDTAASDDILRWRIRDNNNNTVQSALYEEGQTAVGDVSIINFASFFRAILTSSAGPMRSNLTFTSKENLNRYTVQCIIDTTVSCRIMIPDPPAPSEINKFDVTPTYVNISWPVSTHPCFKEYRLISRSADNSTAIDRVHDRSVTSILLPISQLNDTEYSYTLYVTDTADRFMVPQVSRVLTPNVPLSVANLTLMQTDYPTDTNETVNITVSWNERQSSRPPATQYNIQSNISNGLQIISTNVTSQTLSGFSVGLVYTVSVEAVNVLGTGTAASATITILATSTTEISSTSTSVSSSNSVIRSTPTMTPSSSMTPSNTPTSQAPPLSPGAIAGIIIAIIVLGVLIILVIAIVFYVTKKNQDKPAPSVAPQTFEAINYAQVNHSANSSSSKRQAPPKPAKSNSQEADNQVVYSAIQKLEASHNSPPQEGTEYADLDHSAASLSGRHNQRPKDTSNQVQYSHVSHHDRR